MKRILFVLLILLVPIVTPLAQPFPLSGRQFDMFTLSTERAGIAAVYARWLSRWGATPQGTETPSTMLHLMLGVGQGLRLTPSELDYIHRTDATVIRRAQLVLTAVRSRRR